MTTKSSADAATVRAFAPGSGFDRDDELLHLNLDKFEYGRGRTETAGLLRAHLSSEEAAGSPGSRRPAQTEPRSTFAMIILCSFGPTTMRWHP